MGTGGSFPRGKAVGRSNSTLTTISCHGQKCWRYSSTPQHVFMASCLIKYGDNFTFPLHVHEYSICTHTGVNKFWVSSPVRQNSDLQTFPHKKNRGHVTGLIPHQPTDRHVTCRTYKVLSLISHNVYTKYSYCPRLPTTAARVRARVRSCGICGGQSGTGASFLIVLRFPLPIRIPPIASQSPPSIILGWYNRPSSGRSTKWTQSHPMRAK
jgi:hypothetical protein